MSGVRVEKSCLKCFFLVMLIVISMQAYADEVKISPWVRVEEEYNDNIFFSTSEKTRDWITTVKPGIDCSRSTERLSVSATGGLGYRKYGKYKELDRTDRNISGQFQFYVTPKFSVSGNAGLVKDSSSGREVESTGLVLGADLRKRRSMGMGGSCWMSELTQVSFSYNYSEDDWDRPSLNDMHSNALNWGLVHDIGRVLPETVAVLNAGYARYAYGNIQEFRTGFYTLSVSQETEIDYSSFSAGIERQLTEIWKLSGSLGAGYIRTREQSIRTIQYPVFPWLDENLTESSVTGGWTEIILGGIEYNGERTSFSVNLSHDFGAPSGSTGTTTRSSISMNLRRRFTYELTGSLQASYFINKADREDPHAVDTDEETLNLTPGLRYNLDNNWFVQAIFRVSRKRYNLSDTDVGQHYFFVGMHYQYDLADK